MDIRENGANGVSVVRLVNKEYLPENANAIHQLHSMVENNVMEIQTKLKPATKMFHAQVMLVLEF